MSLTLPLVDLEAFHQAGTNTDAPFEVRRQRLVCGNCNQEPKLFSMEMRTDSVFTRVSMVCGCTKQEARTA